MRIGAVVLWVALVLLLVGSMLFAYSGVGEMPAAGWIALICGVVFSFIIGVGLMTLLFFSSRRGYDAPARLVDPAQDDEASDRPCG
jgi:hypothetical protein